MNLSHSWLKDFVDHDLSPEALRDLITSRVATVDAVERLRADLAPFVVARVVEAARHPDSDRLSVTRVDDGSGEILDVVCGAPNVTAGKLYPFARTGTTMPNGITIERRKIRGAVSNGMLCSARELGLGEEHDGILELDVDVSPGTPFLEAVPVADARIVVDVMPTRPDLLSHLGIAREVSAALGRPLGAFEAIARHAGVSAPWNGAVVRDAREATVGDIRVVLEDAEGSPRYMGAIVRGVKVGPSPDWLRARLEAVGSRSINNIVDATNFMLHGYGQPMHAFDARKLGGNAVVVRRGRPRESLVTLDGSSRTLTDDMTIIADAARATAIAGVMGGRESEVSDETTDIFLEVASFEPRRVRRTRRTLGLTSDASYRFERGVDPATAEERLREAVALIVALAGGTPEPVAVDLYPSPAEREPLRLRADRVRRLLGDRVPAAQIVTLLESVGFTAAIAPGTEMLDGNEELVVRAPTWRRDVVEEVDLIEEVARLRGYDTFPDELRPYRPTNVPDAPLHLTTVRLQDALSAEGLYEVRPLPFVAGDDHTHVRVANPIAENEAHLRRSVLETLARRAEHNLAHMQRNVRVFEIGGVFAPSRDRLPVERAALGILVMGDRRPSHFTEPRPPQYDEWDAKALGARAAETAFPGARVELVPADGDGDALWEIRVGGEARGRVARVPLDAPVWAAPAFGVEVDLGLVDSADVADAGRHAEGEPPARARPVRVVYRPLPTTPAADVDLALLVPDGVSAAAVESAVRRSAGELLERLELFDEFRGGAVPAGFRSLAWRLIFRDPTRTLRDKEIEGRRQKILRTLEGELGVRQRTA